MDKKKLALVTLGAVLTVGVFGAAGVLGMKAVLAATGTSGYPAIIQNLASKFGLNPQDVSQVFTDTKKQQISTRLDEAVTEKEITSDQKTKILAEMDTVSAQITNINNQSLTAQQRSEQLAQLRTDVEKWATDNGIPSRFAMLALGGARGGRGMGEGMRGFGFGMLR